MDGDSQSNRQFAEDGFISGTALVVPEERLDNGLLRLALVACLAALVAFLCVIFTTGKV